MDMRVENTEVEIGVRTPFEDVDFYKTGHPGMYPKNTKLLVTNWTPRSDHLAPVLPEFYDHKIVWFGITGFIKKFLIERFQNDFFGRSKASAMRRYQRRMDNSLGPGKVKTNQLAALWDLGYLPLEIRAIREGNRVNIKVPPAIFISTHEDFAFLASYFETTFSCENWKPASVATIAFEYRKLLTYFARQTGAPEEFVNWQGHDFSFRGMSGVDDAMRCGAGHLMSFYGTDTIPAIDYLEDMYGANSDQEIVGGSIPASEHSVMALRILLTMKLMLKEAAFDGKSYEQVRRLAEKEVIRQFVEEDFPDSMISLVCDTFDFWNVITVIAPELKDIIRNRKKDALGNAKVVFRPDSGDPVEIIAGTSFPVRQLNYVDGQAVIEGGFSSVVCNGEYFVVEEKNGNRVYRKVENPTPQMKGAVECLWETFGGALTAKGFRMLDPCVGLIYGDSITLERAFKMLWRLAMKGYASSNVVLGIGSYTYNYLTRDCFGWAMKAIFAIVDDMEIDIYKDPATDSGVKKSARGLPRVEKEGDNYRLYEEQTQEEFQGGELEPFFRNSELLIDEPASVIRPRLWETMKLPECGFEEMQYPF